MTHPAAGRSWHPTHAITAIGPAAAELVRDDMERGALGRGCALDKHAQVRKTPKLKIHRVDPEYGSTLRSSYRDFQSHCWVNKGKFWVLKSSTIRFDTL